MVDADLVGRMNEELQALSEREKETLRLLLSGHDAKSIARRLGLSVHTINERLRDARRKLGVSSSREAARLLAQAEQPGPDSLRDKELGVAGEASYLTRNEHSHRRLGAGQSVAWLSGGMLIMSLIVAAFALSFAFQGNGSSGTQAQKLPSNGISEAVTDPGERPAREWMALLDNQRWDANWRLAAALFQSHISAAQWASTVEPVRRPLGAVSSRRLQSATKSTSLPGVPAGEYDILQFQTNFAQRSGATETVVLVREGSEWKVAGYFIR